MAADRALASAWTRDRLRARLIGRDMPDTAVDGWEASASAWTDDAAPSLGTALHPAAVLVGIVTGDNPGVLLTKRTAALRRHPGQVSFPGGRIDPGDANAEAAALREAREEVGLDPAQVEILGSLFDYTTATGYRITPVLGLIADGFAVTPCAAEVDVVFQLSLTVLLDPFSPSRRQAEFGGVTRHFWVWPHPEHYIWGATAAILVHLAHRLRGGEAVGELEIPAGPEPFANEFEGHGPRGSGAAIRPRAQEPPSRA